MGLFSLNKVELHDEMLDEHTEHLSKKCDEFNENFHPGDFIRYWYNNDKDWNSTFAFVTTVAGCNPSFVNPNWISKVWFKVITLPLYFKRNEFADSVVEITGSFHCEKATEETFIEYKHNMIEKSIKSDKNNIKLLKEHIRTQIKERSNLISNLEHNMNTIKKIIANGGTYE